MALKGLKGKAWKLTSELVRRKAADHNGLAECVTCGKQKPWQELDAGHFVPKSRGLAVYFLIENIHPQCKGCNMVEGGRFEDYYPYMVDMYGQEGVDEIVRLSKTIKKYTKQDYIDLIEDLQRQLDELS